MIKPLGRRVMVSRKEVAKKTAGGLYLPDNATEKPQEAVVVATGNPHNEEGELMPYEVSPGDNVLINKYGGTEVTYEGTTYTIIHERDIIAVL